RRGAREPSAAASVAVDVAAESGARPVGNRLDAEGVRAQAQSSTTAARGAGGSGVKILDRYVLREFLIYLLLGLVGFIAIFIVVDIFEKIDVFLDHHAELSLIARFYLYRAPEVV